MTERADTDDYRALFLTHTPLMDTRAPAEFARGAFPMAISLPLMTDEERARFTDLNAAYADKHGFPFIIAVRDHDKAGILAAFERRIDNDRETEFAGACRQVERIAELRLGALFAEEDAR